MRWLWRNALSQLAHALVRRSHLRRQRHGLLEHLWRQLAHHAVDFQPRGARPAWSNSLFEDNAEFGFGMRLTLDALTEKARGLLRSLSASLDRALCEAILNADQSTEAGVRAQRERVAELKARLQTLDSPEAQQLLEIADVLVRKSVWIVGGDGWAYDIGYGGLDHVLASGRNVKLLVLDTEVLQHGWASV